MTAIIICLNQRSNDTNSCYRLKSFYLFYNLLLYIYYHIHYASNISLSFLKEKSPAFAELS